MLSIAELRVTFHTAEAVVHAVSGVDLDVAKGEVLALVGESGSGKSVSMLSVMGLLPPATAEVTGSIRFEGRELTNLSRAELNHLRGDDIAMVFQDPMSSLNPVHTVGKQIAESLRLHRDISRRDAREKAIRLLDRVGIPDPARRVDAYPYEFSGGMRQRAMIAIALACEPKLLIADEPTTALDVTVQSQIVELVRDLQADFGMAVVWITHDLGVVAELADRVAVMYGGRIMETGRAADVYRRARHPYTSGLLRCIPRMDRPTERLLPEIPGAPRTVTAPLEACAFAERCPMCEDDCTYDVPELLPTDPTTHLSACIHASRMQNNSGIDWRPPVELAPPAEDSQHGDVVVAVRGLRVHFPVGKTLLGPPKAVVRAVDDVDLDIRRGRTLGLVGESGCGKTTLGRSLVGLVEPTAGTVELDGRSVTESGPDRRRIQMIFQDPFSAMNPGMRVGDVIAEPMRIHRMGDKDTIRTRVGQLLEQVGLSAAIASRHPHEFSGGQRQRIAVARALAPEPDVVVCDEAVSALDVSVQAQIVNLLKSLQEQRSLSYLFIAHDLAVVRHISHEVAVMYLGQIVERAPRDELYANPLHPYTQALLAAVPSPDPLAETSSVSPLKGDLPSPADPPPGCRFHTRCPLAVPGLCDRDEPALRPITADRLVACHLVDDSAQDGELRGPVSAGTQDPT